VTKFVGKFRKHKDYKDDYTYARDFLQNKKRRSETPEVKKKMMEWDHDNHEHDGEYDD
jgi:hypothetical protein